MPALIALPHRAVLSDVTPLLFGKRPEGCADFAEIELCPIPGGEGSVQAGMRLLHLYQPGPQHERLTSLSTRRPMRGRK